MDEKLRKSLSHMTGCVDLVLGALLGKGISRTVYQCRLDPGLVIKLEDPAEKRFQNVTEWQTWDEASELHAARDWLAEPKWISENGLVLFMETTCKFNDTGKSWKVPERVPLFLSDLKSENFGWVHRRRKWLFVCHDYGLNLSINHGLNAYKTRKVEWKA